MVERINSFPDFSEKFGDKRIEKRAHQLLSSLTIGRKSSLRQITANEADQKSFYRLFNNESFSEESIVNSIVSKCGELCKGRHVLCIQDTSEFNLTKQKGRLKPNSGLGRTTKEGELGFMLHSSMVIDADKSTALGYSFIKTWQRDENAPDRHERKYKSLPVEEKESYKWIEATRRSCELLDSAEKITIIADRESDMYDLLAGDYGDKTHFLIRTNFNRKIKGTTKLIEHLNSLPVMHQYDLSVKGDIRKQTKNRIAQMQLKWDKVSLIKPDTCKNKELSESKDIYVVEVKEDRTNGILWRIYTTHSVSNIEEALEIVALYKQRWFIEQVHRLLKTEGFEIERSQLEQGWAIRKLTLLAMMATLRIIQMMLAYEDTSEQQSIDEVFDKEQQKCLQVLNAKLEGKTDKLKNDANTITLKWATWVIARLGGWKGYRSQRKPGPIVLQKGLAKFYITFEGWMLYQNLEKDVSTQ